MKNKLIMEFNGDDMVIKTKTGTEYSASRIIGSKDYKIFKKDSLDSLGTCRTLNELVHILSSLEGGI